MKPITLTLEKFGPFVQKTEIDFRTVSKDGVFLITGETGSGKTTIFDAICFALYGQANGNDRDPKNFRSEYAGYNQNATVDLTFECHGKEYKIHREPQYTRGTFKEDGTFVPNKKPTNQVVALYLPNGDIKSGDEVKYVIQEILGLTCEQFRQVVMIAQGEFKKFLLASSKEKGEILGTIFGTQKYDRFIELLKGYLDDRNTEYSNAFSTLVSAVSSFSSDETWDYYQQFEEWKKLPQSVEKKDVEIVLPHFKGYINKLSEEKATLESAIRKAEESIDTLNQDINFHERMNESINARSRLISQLEGLQAQQGSIDETKRTLQRLEDAMAIREDYTDCLKVARQGKDLKNQLGDVNDSIASYEESLDGMYAQRESLLNGLPCEVADPNEVVVELSSKVNTLQHRVSELDYQTTQVNSTINSISNYERELHTLQAERIELANRTDEKSHLEKEYSEHERLYNLNIAGMLAERLEEGMPCEVCGSTHHPKLATKCFDAPSEGQLETLKRELERYQAQYLDYQTKVLLHNQRMESTKLQILDSATKLGISADTVDGAKVQLVALRDSTSLEVSNTQYQVENLNYCIDAFKAIDSQISELSYSLTGLVSSKETISKQLEDTNTQYRELWAVYLQSLKDRNFANKDEHLALLKRCGDYDYLNQTVIDFENQVRDCNSRISEYSKAIGEHTYLDVTDLRDTLSVETSKYRSMLDRCTKVSYMLKEDTKVYDTATSSVQDMLDKYQKYKDAERLCKFAMGTIRDEVNKVAFNNYVQAYYFDMVLASANEKIKVMSSERYTLINVSKAHKRSGLDISVFDTYTGTDRGASTLSGGESFMASLSLALGLSEVVQRLSGGIKIDAMFIDEGFGTLDSGESLQNAIEVIRKLATNDRMVGIISHVSELQECIPNKLMVVKSKEGSKIVTN